MIDAFLSPFVVSVFCIVLQQLESHINIHPLSRNELDSFPSICLAMHEFLKKETYNIRGPRKKGCIFYVHHTEKND